MRGTPDTTRKRARLLSTAPSSEPLSRPTFSPEGRRTADPMPPAITTASQFLHPSNIPTVSRPDFLTSPRRHANLSPSPPQERRLGTQALKRRRGPVERDCLV